MTTSKGLVSLRILGITLIVAASVLLVMTGSQNAMAQCVIGTGTCPDQGSESKSESGQSEGSSIVDVIVEEAAEAGNATMTNQTNGNMTSVEFLAIQNAQSGSLSEINATAYTLQLNNVSDKTILFSDRPDRIVMSISTSDFIGNWTFGPDSYAVDPPNAALVVEETQTVNLDTSVIELFSPVYDLTTDTLTYTIVAENATSINLPSEFGQSILVVDSPDNVSGRGM